MNFKNVVVPIALGVIGLMSCEPSEKSDKKIFKMNLSSLNSLDPAFARDQNSIWMDNQIYSGLVQMDDSLNIQPDIAKRWIISDSGKTYHFHLRNDVYFHPDSLFEGGKSRRLTAADMVYSLRRIIDPEIASSGAWIFNDKIDTTNPFSAADDTTLVIRLRKAFPPFLGLLSMQYCYAVPKEVCEFWGKDFRMHPVGTGPFRFKSWLEGDKLVLLRNENYYGDFIGNLDAINVSFINNKKSEFLNFKQGRLHFISGLDPAYKDELLDRNGQLKANWKDEFQLLRSSYLNTEYLGIRIGENGQSILQNKAIRQAINYGFDRKEMIRYLRNNVGIAANAGMVPAGMPGFDAEKVKGYDYQPEKAKELLNKAGYPGGKGLPEIRLYTSEAYLDYASYISAHLKEIGLSIRIELTQGSILKEWMSQGKAGFFRGSWIADYPDPENYLSLFYGKNGSPPNYTNFQNPRFDSLYELSMIESNQEIRQAMVYEMERIVLEEAVVVPLYYDEVMRFSRKDVKGLGINPINLLVLKRVEI